MRLRHCRTHVGVPQQFLQRPDVVPIFQQVRREGVPKRVTRRPLRDPRRAYSLLHGPLHRSLMRVMAAKLPGDDVAILPRGGKHPLPRQVNGPRRLAVESPGLCPPCRGAPQSRRAQSRDP